MDLELTYTKIGDYYYPDIALPDTTKYHIGRYGRMHQRYLKEHRPVIWGQLSLMGDLSKHLFEIDTACNEQMRYLIKEMAKREGVTEALKAADPMTWVEQIRVSNTYTTDEQQKRVKIREIEIIYNFIGAFDFEGAREQSQTAQDKNNAKVGAA